MSDQSATATESRHNRPAMLTLMCVLSFISNGIMVLIGLCGIFLSGYVARLMDEYSKGNDSLGRNAMLVFSFSLMLVFGLKLWGALLMFLGRKGGYVLYLIPTALVMILNIVLIFATYNFFAIGYLLISIVFILLYSIFLKHIK